MASIRSQIFSVSGAGSMSTTLNQPSLGSSSSVIS
jgi:hypothetical protein